MCYPLPGPRCSAHAAVALAKAQAAESNALRQRGLDFDAYQVAHERLLAAQAAYDMTPAGIKTLTTSVLSGHANEEDVKRLQEGKRARAEALATIGLTEQVARDQHGVSAVTYTGEGLNDIAFDDEDYPIALGTAGVESSFQNSLVWASTLRGDEIAAANWFTSDGNHPINRYLLGTGPDDFYAKRGLAESEVAAQVRVLDEAFARYEGPSVHVYRGIGAHTMPAGFEGLENGRPMPDEIRSWLAKTYPVGEVVETKAFSSTSYDAAKASGFATGTNVVLSIKTTRAVPIAAVSELQNGEREAVLRRNTRLRVTNVRESQRFRTFEFSPSNVVTQTSTHFIVELEEV